VRTGDAGLEGRDVVRVGLEDRGVGIAVDGGEGLRRAGAHVVERLLVGRDDAVLSAGLDGHVADGDALVDGEGGDGLSGELHGAVGGAVDADVADDAQDHVLGGDVVWLAAVQDEADGLGDLQQDLAGAHDEARVRVADARGEGAEGAVAARVGIGADDDLAGAHVPLLGQAEVADAAVGGRAGIVEVGEVLLLGERAHRVDVAVGLLVLREDVVVRHDDDALAVEDLGVGAEFAVEDADRAGAADIVGEQNVDLRPDVVAGFDVVEPGGAGDDFFRDRHFHRMGFVGLL